MKLNEWVQKLPLKAKLSVIFVLVIMIAALLILSMAFKNSIAKKDLEIQSYSVSIEKKQGQINVLLARIEVRDSANKMLVAQNDKLTFNLKASEAKRVDVYNKYSKELARRQQLDDTGSYLLFLRLTNKEDFPGQKIDSAYMVPIESIKEANMTYAQRDALSDINALLMKDIDSYRLKTRNLETLLSNSNSNISDLNSALNVSQSKGKDYEEKLAIASKQLKQQKVITKAVAVGAVGIIILLLF